jgi:NAD-dependent DNA ligase
MIQELVGLIKEANNQYRLGTPIMSDFEYDNLISELSLIDPDNEILNEVGIVVSDERKSRLPIIMASLNKEKSIDDVIKWARLKSIGIEELVILTPKYDGLSLCVDETTQNCWTRGDGTFGQKSDEHYKLVQNKLKNNQNFKYTYGEIIMKKETFLQKYSNDFANPRNLVAGLMNSKTIQNSLSDCFYIKYGAETNKIFQTKKEILEELNRNQKVQVPFIVTKISDLNEEIILSLFKEWSREFEIDGIIIEINSLERQLEIGRDESTNNPKFAIAFKSQSFEQTTETEIIQIDWNVSKNGLLKPIARLKPVKLDGVTISNVTCNNARFVKDLGLGTGAIVRIVRSGMVIPKIIDVIKSVPFQMPNVPNIDWNENGVELMTLTETDEQRFKQTVSFFEILEVDNVGEGVVKQLWDAGFDSVKAILELTPDKLSKLEGFGKRKAMIVYNSIQSKIKDVQLSKLQHATGFFKGLGGKKLALLEHFETKPTLDEVISIEGFAQTSAESYLESYDKFFNFVKELPVTIAKKIEAVKVSNDLDGTSFVFTGVRRADLEAVIESRGGKIGSGVSKNTTHLVMKAVGSGSSKEKKAIELGVKIMTVTDLENLLK